MLHRNVQKLDPREQHYWIESPRRGMQLFLRYLPPLTRQTSEVRPVLYVHGATFPFLVQMKLCLETAGSSLKNVLKCNVCIARRSRNLQRSTRSTPDISPRTRPLGSLSAFPHGRDHSISKWIASPFERTLPSKTAMASIVFK